MRWSWGGVLKLEEVISSFCLCSPTRRRIRFAKIGTHVLNPLQSVSFEKQIKKIMNSLKSLGRSGLQMDPQFCQFHKEVRHFDCMITMCTAKTKGKEQAYRETVVSQYGILFYSVTRYTANRTEGLSNATCKRKPFARFAHFLSMIRIVCHTRLCDRHPRDFGPGAGFEIA
jgi:hypothetical protein